MKILTRALRLDILFATGALQRLCHDNAIALRTLDIAVVRKLRARLDDLTAAASLSYAAKLPGRFHFLTEAKFALHLCTGYRLVITSAEKPIPRNADGTVNLDKISSIIVILIGKVHD